MQMHSNWETRYFSRRNIPLHKYVCVCIFVSNWQQFLLIYWTKSQKPILIGQQSCSQHIYYIMFEKVSCKNLTISQP